MYYVYAFYCTRYSTLYVRPCVRPDSVVIFKNHLLSSLCGISLEPYARAMRMPDGAGGSSCLGYIYLNSSLTSYISPPSHRLRVRPRTVDRPHTVDRSHTDTGLSASHLRTVRRSLPSCAHFRERTLQCAVCTLCAPLLDRACSVRPQNVIPSCKHACT